MARSEHVTELLDAAARGEAGAEAALLERVYGELQRLAGGLIAREAPGCSLQATILVHDAWMELVGDAHAGFERRAHFFGAAARAMRRTLVDHARRRDAARRGGRSFRVTFCDMADARSGPPELEMLALNEALEEFARIAADAARVVELRYFVGLTIEETAKTVGRSLATVKREWAYARAWLHERLRRDDPEGT